MAMMGEDVLEGLQENIHQIGHIQFADCRDAMNPIQLKYRMSKFFHGLSKVLMRAILRQNINLKWLKSVIYMEKKYFSDDVNI